MSRATINKFIASNTEKDCKTVFYNTVLCSILLLYYIIYIAIENMFHLSRPAFSCFYGYPFPSGKYHSYTQQYFTNTKNLQL